ncbi:MAG: hypothetical protein JRG91_13425 [Deltaproteobacteria bacterium]|nr:hypothetical protein [Deltaproteobacteria bacterium]
MGRASLLTAVTLALALAAPAISHAQGKSEAKQRFQKGVKLFKKGNHEGALVEFRAAYDAKPNWRVRYNIGMTLYKLDRYVEADVELRAYILEGGDSVPEKTLTEVQSILFEIQAYIGTVDVSCDVVGAKIYVDGVFVSTYPLDEPLPLDVGEYVFEVRAAGQDPMSKKLSVPGGKEISANFTFIEPEEPLDEPVDEPVDEPDDQETTTPEKSSRVKKPIGKPLLISGAVIGGAGLVAGVLGIALYAYDSDWLWSQSVGLMAAGFSTLGVGLTLTIVGVLRLKKEKKAGLALTPYFSPIRGGGMLGLAASF